MSGLPISYVLPATVDRAGTMPAGAYQAYSGRPGTDPTADIDTTGASFTYSQATITIPSLIDASTVTNVEYRYCYDVGLAAANPGGGVIVVLCAGFGQPRTAFSDADLQRIASYRGTTGRFAIVLAVSTRQTGSVSGTKDQGARDAWDRLAAARDVVSRVGAEMVFGGGHCIVWLGVSTGAHDAAMMACHFPDETGAVVAIFPNADPGLDPKDGYWARQGATPRASLTSWIGDRGTGTEDELAPWMARDAVNALADVVAMPGGPHVWVLGDWSEPVGISRVGRLIEALRANPAAAPKVHAVVTNTGDTHRILHDNGFSHADTVYHERKYWPTILGVGVGSAQPWTVPAAGSLHVLGYVVFRAVTGQSDPAENRPAVEIWTGLASPPKTAGGQKHAARLVYRNRATEFRLTPYTSLAGYAEVLCDDDIRIKAISQGVEARFDLRVSETITEAEQAGIEHEFRAGVNITGPDVTAWGDRIGALSLTGPTGAKPTAATAGDGKAYVAAASTTTYVGQRLTMASALWNPTQDFTVIVVFHKTNTTTPQILVEVGSHGVGTGLAASNLWYNSGSDQASRTLDNGASGLSGNVGGHPISTTTRHIAVMMQKAGRLYESLDGGPWSEADISGTFSTGSLQTTVFAGWANGGGQTPWDHWDGGVYDLLVKSGATSWANLISLIALMKSRWAIT